MRSPIDWNRKSGIEIKSLGFVQMSAKSLKSIPIVPFFRMLLRIFSLKKNLLKEIELMHQEYGEVYALKVGGLKCFIKRPEMIKRVLVDNHLNYEKGDGFKLFLPVVGYGLLTSDGKKWASERKVLNREFQRQNYQSVAQQIKNQLVEMSKDWDKEVSINFTKEINILTVKNVCQNLFDYQIQDDINQLRQWFHDYDHYLGRQQKSLIKVPLSFPLGHLRRARAAIKGLRGFAHKVRIHQIQRDDENMIKRMALAGFDEETICDHILTFFIAGHETTANSVNFTMLLLRDHPVVLNQLLNEVLDQGTESVYLEAVLKESLRLFPTIPLFPRVAKADDIVDGFKIKKGDMIAFSPWIMHRCPEHWESPLEFRPERFIGQKYEKEFKYLPFSLGPRKCIGEGISLLQMKEIFVFLLANFEFDISGPSLKDVRHNVSLCPDGDVFLDKLKRR